MYSTCAVSISFQRTADFANVAAAQQMTSGAHQVAVSCAAVNSVEPRDNTTPTPVLDPLPHAPSAPICSWCLHGIGLARRAVRQHAVSLHPLLSLTARLRLVLHLDCYDRPVGRVLSSGAM